MPQLANTLHDGSFPDTFHHLEKILIKSLPEMNIQEQLLAVTLYRLLSQGKPVTIKQLALSANLDQGDVETILKKWPLVFYSYDKNIIGFWGLTIQPMSNVIHINGTTVYAWCTWNTLLIPFILNKTVDITSACAQTDNPISLVVSPHSAISALPGDIYVSIPSPESLRNISNAASMFSYFFYFFESKQAGEAWVNRYHDTILIRLEDAFEMGRRINSTRYGEVLNARKWQQNLQ